MKKLTIELTKDEISILKHALKSYADLAQQKANRFLEVKMPVSAEEYVEEKQMTEALLDKIYNSLTQF